MQPNIGRSGPMPTAQVIHWNERPAGPTITLYAEGEHLKLFTVTVKIARAEIAIQKLEDQGYTVRHPGYSRKQVRAKAEPKPEPVGPVPFAPLVVDPDKKYGKDAKPVLCLNTGQIFPSMSDAAHFSGAYQQQVYVACSRPGALCKGYQFRFATSEEQQHGFKGELIPVSTVRGRKKAKI